MYTFAKKNNLFRIDLSKCKLHVNFNFKKQNCLKNADISVVQTYQFLSSFVRN